MSIEIWLAFIAATSLLTLLPGPCVMLVTTQALTHGMSSALLCILGNTVACVALMVLSLMGIGTILAASATLFTLVKWLGVIYMAYLGCCQIHEARRDRHFSDKNDNQYFSTGSFRIGFLTSLLNPKAILFYMAFLPQFMHPGQGVLLQFLVLTLTSSVVVAAILTGYAFIASGIRQWFQSRRAQRYLNYSGGSFLLGGSLWMASMDK